jgi:hypothetical protein
MTRLLPWVGFIGCALAMMVEAMNLYEIIDEDKVIVEVEEKVVERQTFVYDTVQGPRDTVVLRGKSEVIYKDRLIEVVKKQYDTIVQTEFVEVYPDSAYIEADSIVWDEGVLDYVFLAEGPIYGSYFDMKFNAQRFELADEKYGFDLNAGAYALEGVVRPAMSLGLSYKKIRVAYVTDFRSLHMPMVGITTRFSW